MEEDEGDYTPGPDHMDRDRIRICDGKTDRGFVTRKELKKAVENAVRTTENFTVEELGEWDILNLFCEDDRCYIQVQVTGTHDKINYMDSLVFSKSTANGTLRYGEPESEGVSANDVTEEIEERSILPDEDAFLELKP